MVVPRVGVRSCGSRVTCVEKRAKQPFVHSIRSSLEWRTSSFRLETGRLRRSDGLAHRWTLCGPRYRRLVTSGCVWGGAFAVAP